MSNQILYYIIGVTAVLFIVILIGYFLLKKQLNKGEMKRIRELREGTKEKSFTSEILYQKLYMYYKKIPLIKGYLLRIRRKLEIINIEDEYKTRLQASKVITRALLIIIPTTLVVILITRNNAILLSFLLLFEFFLADTIMNGMVDKLDTKLLKQQVEFFAQIRHAYHEYNMVEEAIYEVSQNDELEVARQGAKIHEILISDDPETELEKYYDIAPNSYLKEFAGISYLTKEFGDRTIDGASLYLRNLNNITEEMQLEILKRDKLEYVFQSLPIISIIAVLLIEPLKNWAVGNFSFTSQFYNGKGGLIVEILLVFLTFISYLLIRKVKDSGSIKDEYKDPNKTWQMKLYKNPIINKIVNLFMPKKNTKEYRKNVKLLKEAAAKQKMEAMYVNKIAICLATFIFSIVMFILIHTYTIKYIYEEPTSDYNLMSDTNYEKGMEITEHDNEILDKLKGNPKITKEKIKEQLLKTKYYMELSDKEINLATDRIYEKLQIVNKETFKWFELLLAFIFGWIGYMVPHIMLKIQIILRKLEMENEVMQFQTIILMLMKIERVNVEMILEWLERYSNIFKEPISKCVNNYESGAWEALEELKNEIAFPQLIQIVESLQAAVEQIPISEAFDELDNEREYYKAKRAEANERLISKKALIGKIIGFAPMIGVFVGYLILPLLVIGLSSIQDTFATMSV